MNNQLDLNSGSLPSPIRSDQKAPRIVYKYLSWIVASILFTILVTYIGQDFQWSSLINETDFVSTNVVSEERVEVANCLLDSLKMDARKELGNITSNVLVTGGAGYIATHTIVCLLQAGYDVTVVDNLVNSNKEALNRVKKILALEPNSTRITFYHVDLNNFVALEEVFKSAAAPFHSCIHFAGLKAVGESVQKPLLYYNNNLMGTINLLHLLDKYNTRSLVFSSSATVYGSAKVPITEETPTGTGITNPYGRTKFMIEDILKDFKKSKDLTVSRGPSSDYRPWSIVILRYFNPVGAHPSGLIGEDPNGIPNNLMPYILQVAVGKRDKLTVFGGDYSTKDGTGVRDYIHVMDLAAGHVSALTFMDPPVAVGKPKNDMNSTTSRSSIGSGQGGAGHGKYSVFNLGTGKGYSVLEIIAAMKKASGRPIPYELGPRRVGDIAVCYADVSKASKLLKWAARKTLDDMCTDGWKWQSRNPNGFEGKL